MISEFDLISNKIANSSQRAYYKENMSRFFTGFPDSPDTPDRSGYLGPLTNLVIRVSCTISFTCCQTIGQRTVLETYIFCIVERLFECCVAEYVYVFELNSCIAEATLLIVFCYRSILIFEFFTLLFLFNFSTSFHSARRGRI